jgi:hypothetical protein
MRDWWQKFFAHRWSPSSPPLGLPTTFPPMREFHALCVKFSRIGSGSGKLRLTFIGFFNFFWLASALLNKIQKSV